MKVRVLVRDHQVDISAGNGSQSFQWLASVVQSRLKQYNILRKSLEDDSYIVTEIRNTNGELINPKDKLYEHAGPTGLVVSATVATAFPVDDWENPHMNDWMQASYVHSNIQQHWSQEIDAWRTNLEHIKQTTGGVGDFNTLNSALLAQKVMPQSAQLIKIGFDFTQADVELAFNLDWQAMQWKWLSARTGITNTGNLDLLKSKIGDIMKDHYALICNIFTHYAGVGKVGQRYGMTIEEFGHFFHFMRVFDWKEDEETIEYIFFQTAYDAEAERRKATASTNNLHSNKAFSGPSSSGDKWILMTRAHFTEAVVAVAINRKLADTHDQSLKRLLEGPMMTFWESISSKYMLYTTSDPALKQAYEEYALLLKQAFHQRATIDSKFGPRMPATDFMQMMKDATLVDIEQETMCIGCFLQAQLNPPVQYELEYLVFVEFVEAMQRLAMKAIDGYNNGLNDTKKIRIGFSLIIEQTVGEGTHK